MEKRKRLAFDLDETLGTAIVDSQKVVGFNTRHGTFTLLDQLSNHYELILWTVSNRVYLDKVLAYGMAKYFEETYSWDEISEKWKDIRKIRADFLVDDSDYHRGIAAQYGLESNYIIVPAYGSLEDQRKPLLWIDIIKDSLACSEKINSQLH